MLKRAEAGSELENDGMYIFIAVLQNLLKALDRYFAQICPQIYFFFP